MLRGREYRIHARSCLLPNRIGGRLNLASTVLSAVALSLPCFAQAPTNPESGASSPSIHRQQAIAQLERGRTREALTEFQAAVAEQPNDAESHDYIGVILGDAGNLNDALAEFEQAARLNSALPEPHYHLGLVED